MLLSRCEWSWNLGRAGGIALTVVFLGNAICEGLGGVFDLDWE